MIAALLALLLAAQSAPYEMRGQATWYGSTQRTACVDGFLRTCTPYLSKQDGGRGGELTMYAAVGTFKNFRDKPYEVDVCRLDTYDCVRVVVRDYCDACAKDGDAGRVIDLSPHAFKRLAPLGLGVIRVVVRRVYPARYQTTPSTPRDATTLRVSLEVERERDAGRGVAGTL